MITIGNITIDAALREQHTLRREITSFPVEEGSDVTDHSRRLPRVLVVEGIVSDTPIGRAAAVRENPVTSPDEVQIEPTVPSMDTFAALELIHAAGEPVTVSSSLKLYENMIMEELSIPRDAETGEALKFSATFREVIIVENRRTSIAVRTATPGGKRKRKLGMKPALKFDSELATYWCVEDQQVWIKPEDYDAARRMQRSSTGEVWTDWVGLPTPAYSKSLVICLRKEPVQTSTVSLPGTGLGLKAYTVTGRDGKQRAMTDAEQRAMEADMRERAGITELERPIDARTGRPLVQTSRASGSDPNKPWQYDYKASAPYSSPEANRLLEEQTPMAQLARGLGGAGRR